jgi:predicted 3-demethylubiquinone-9 3-methyltransferase (glyoxalase superfamily)
MTNQTIVPHLWYDKEAQEAAAFYASVFGQNPQSTDVTTIDDTPSGSADIVAFEIFGQPFVAISAGPMFTINPSISFHLRCRTAAEVDEIYDKLAPGGIVMMPLGAYPFSQRYSWVQDKYGVSWQIICTQGDWEQRIMPAMMFTKEVCGKAEEAINFYASVFPNADAQVLMRYEAGEEPDAAGTVKYAQFHLGGQEFAAMDSAHMHNFTFNEAVSFMVNCKDQAEIDYFWGKLSAFPEAEQCGWLKDRYGVSWQILPANMGELLSRNLARTVPVMLAMKKIIIEDLHRAGNA